MIRGTYVGPRADLYGKKALLADPVELGCPPESGVIYAQFDNDPDYGHGWHPFEKDFFATEVRENAGVTGCAIPKGLKPPERPRELTREQLHYAIEALNNLQLVNHHDYWVRNPAEDGWAWNED